MTYMCEGSFRDEAKREARGGTSASVVKKYTYVLPSGRRLKVVVDDDSELVETASTAPCLLLRMEDEAMD